MELNQLIVLPLLDIMPVEPCAGSACAGCSGSFNAYLQRAQTSSTGAGDNVTSDSSSGSGQSPVSRADDSPSTAAPPPRPKDNEDNINNVGGTDSAGKSSLPTSKSKPVEQDQAGSRTNKGEEDNNKDKSDDRDSVPIGTNQGSQLNAEINAKADNAKNHSQPKNSASSIKTEMEEASNPFRVASKDAKTKKTADSGGPAKAESLSSGRMQSAAAAEAEASVSTSGKKQASKKTALEADKNAGKPAATQTTETAPAAGKGRTSAAKTSKAAAASPHDAQGKNANQNGKMQPSTGRVADAAVSPAVFQEVPAGAATVNSAALQAAVNPPFMPTPAKDKLDPQATDKPSNAPPDNKAANPANALQRLEQPGTKTAASQQGSADESGSELSSVRFVQRVERAFAAMNNGGGTVRLKLSPPELGSLRMEISVNKGVMKARLEAETKEAKNLLLENLPALRDRLAQQNIKIQKFDVDLRDPSSGGTPQQTANQAGTGSGEGGYRALRPPARENGGAAATTTGAPRLANHNGQLNVIV